MPVRAFSILVVWLTFVPAGVASAGAPAAPDEEPPNTPPPTAFNEFYPEERPLGDCLSSLPKPDCGSEARGGWRQITIFGAIIAALAFIAWRVVSGARRARRVADRRMPGATNAPAEHGGDRAP